MVGAWPECPLSELSELYEEGRISFAALLSYSRLLFMRQFRLMSHAEKLVALHQQQREAAQQLPQQQQQQQQQQQALTSNETLNPQRAQQLLLSDEEENPYMS